MSLIIDRKIKLNMAVENLTKNKSSSYKEFEKLLNEDFKDESSRKSNYQGDVTEITKIL